MGTKLRDDAITYVKDGLPTYEGDQQTSKGKWSKWTDVHMLITEHEDHAAAMEGMEAFSAVAYDDANPPAQAPGWGQEEELDAEVGVDANDEDSGDDENDDSSSSADGSSSTGDAEHNQADRLDDDVILDASASPAPAAETPTAPAGSVVAAHSHVVPAGVITDVDEKKDSMVKLAKIFMTEKTIRW